MIYQKKLKIKHNYTTFSIIENSYDNLLQNQFEKLKEIPDLLTKHNENKKKACIFNDIIIYRINTYFINFIFLFYSFNK